MDLGPRGLDNMSTSTFYCWAEDPREASMHQDVFSMTVNQDMVNYFSLSEGHIDPRSFAAIYCLNPLKDDNCPVGICPNPDIAGVLVRYAYYITEFCLTTLIFHAPHRVKDVFYYQLSSIYALLITCCVSLFQGTITRIHAAIVTYIVASPVSIYFLVYSLRAFWGEHRLDTVLGKEHYLNRGLVFLALVIWIFALVYTPRKPRFAQASCDPKGSWQDSSFIEDVFGLVFILAAITDMISWFISIILARKEISLPGERRRPKFVTIWRTINRRFPFVFFMSVGMTPMFAWIWLTGGFLYFTESDNTLSFSFGQILALFIAVPPFLQACQLAPRLWSWFVNLSWIACCWRRKRRGEPSTPVKEPGLSIDDRVESPMLLSAEDRNGEFYEGRQEMQESAIRLEPNRRCES